MNQPISSQIVSEAKELSCYEGLLPADAVPPLSDLDRWRLAVEAAGYLASTRMLERLLEICPDRDCSDAAYLEGVIAGRYSAVALASNDPAPEIEVEQLMRVL